MPLEVREIGIRFSVDDGTAAPGEEAPPEEGNALCPRERAMIVEECVRAVIAELKRGRER